VEPVNSPDDRVQIGADPAAPVRFLGLDFTPMTTADAVIALAGRARIDRPFFSVITPNVDHRVRLQREAALWPLYAGAGLLLNDSRILEQLARLDGLALPASPGADIVAALFDKVVQPDEPVTIIGGRAEDIAALTARFGLTCVNAHNPPPGLRRNPVAIAEAAAFLAAHPARFHFLCVGSPQQEMIAAAAGARGDVVGAGLCCGASLDFLTGRVRRAPAFMRTAGLEWLHRLGSEPGRLARRYLIEGPQIFRIWRDDRKIRRQPHS
jgi:N-acetylglucosaminyldiphosphoundecaprenol N-acetyl-beta-D-mannosaminyltransferase